MEKNVLTVTLNFPSKVTFMLYIHIIHEQQTDNMDNAQWHQRTCRGLFFSVCGQH